MLGAYRIRSGPRRAPAPLRRTLTITLLVKLVMLALLWVLLFRDAGPALDHRKMSDYFFERSSWVPGTLFDREITSLRIGHDYGL